MPVQTRSNRDRLRPRDTFAAATEIGSNDNGALQRRHVHLVASPQRSSLRRALHESLTSSKGAMYSKAPLPRGMSMSMVSSAVPLRKSGTGQAGLRTPEKQKQIRYRTRSVIRRRRPTAGITTNTTTTIRSSKSSHVSALEPRTSRNSLRIAIRESLKTVETNHGHSSLLANYPKQMAADPLVWDSVPIKKPKDETPNRGGDEGNNRRHTSLLLNQKGQAVSLAAPQRSSLRRAIRESLCATTQTSSFTDTALDDIGSSHDTVSNSIIDVSPPTLDDQNSSSISSLSPSTVTNSDISPRLDNNMRAPSQGSLASFISSTTICPSPSVSEAARLMTTPRPRKKPALVATSLTRPPAFPSLLSIPKPVSSASVAHHQLHTEAIPATSISENGKLRYGKDDSHSVSTRRGWHQVHNIINETPSGLYLVEWEGRNPRTGAKVS